MQRRPLVQALERIGRDLLARVRDIVVDLRGPTEQTRPTPPVSVLRAEVDRALAVDDEPPTAAGAPGRWTLVSAAHVDVVLAVLAAALTAELVITRLSGQQPALAHRLVNAAC